MTTTTTVRTTTRPAKETRRRCFHCKGKVSRECREGRRVVAWACGGPFRPVRGSSGRMTRSCCVECSGLVRRFGARCWP